ncbi:MAG TPA: hypothetical protein IAD20_01375 [Candidatus Scatocola faecipullorum]|uniref:DUF4760 domain-containing protein n=1 Tax=Candidatus Scatocola faecipullorum TaxID=2840917 RepID=A0A9D1M341_9PROT|nr:hypothetical protein [Candidatus Scatocola faecipullorum]
MINEISSVVTALATLSMAIVAALALKTWRKEFIGKKKIELSCEIMKTVYEVQDAIIYARVGRISELDIKNVEQWVESEKIRDPEHMGVYPDRFFAWVPHRRLAENQDKLDKLNNFMDDACLYWGIDLMKLIYELNHITLKIRSSAKDLYYNDTCQDPAVLQNILFSNNPNDEITQKVHDIVEEIKLNLEPIYKDQQSKWVKLNPVATKTDGTKAEK